MVLYHPGSEGDAATIMSILSHLEPDLGLHISSWFAACVPDRVWLTFHRRGGWDRRSALRCRSRRSPCFTHSSARAASAVWRQALIAQFAGVSG